MIEKDRSISFNSIVSKFFIFIVTLALVVPFSLTESIVTFAQGEKSDMEIAIAETEKYHQAATLANTSNAGEDVTDQIIRIYRRN
ncbi:hypothetical protein LOY85_25460 [Brevibacillus brevis]|uniref:hypothetical protein n=1 Tax=Brevibacillus brevis TaxID=1393 RepID=UPI001F35A32A|nr:hypothetical protein [Brevibacillus brevis]UIO42103.1 hypothetical protein LOY85_25460 [Brevibacillus brevis]